LSSFNSTEEDDQYGKISGSHSLRVTKQGSATGYVESRNIDVGPSGEFYLRFTFRHIGRQASDPGAGFVVLKLLDANGSPVAEIGFNPPNSDTSKQQYLAYFTCKKNGSGQWTYPYFLGAKPVFDGRPHIIEFRYKPETSVGANDGLVQMHVDGRVAPERPMKSYLWQIPLRE